MADIRYICSKCKFPYETEAEALECESTHQVAESINRYEYGERAKYPTNMEIIFPDHKEAIYTLVKFVR